MKSLKNDIEKDKRRRVLINKCKSFYTSEMEKLGILIDLNLPNILFENKSINDLKKYINTSKKLCKISNNTENLYILL